MAKVTVKLHGEEVTKLTLESGNEYVAGRAPENAIPLNGERGISRHHLKFLERDGVWVAESLSKFVLLQKGGESLEVIELNEAMSFMVPPYEFHFEPSEIAGGGHIEDKPTGASENLPAFYNPRIAAANQAAAGRGPEETNSKVNNEATQAGQAVLIPYFRISYPNTADDEVLKLEGHLWTAGRDPGNEIPVDSPHISRKHFELARTKEGFFITDLGSSNGTKLNGNRIPPHEPTRLDSGDELRIMNISMLFEIRDTQFLNRIDNLPVPAFDPVLSAPPMPWAPNYGDNALTEYRGSRDNSLEEIPTGWKRLSARGLKSVDWKKNKVRVALLVLVPLLVIVALLPEGKKGQPARDPANKENSKTSVVFDNLTPEQKAVVKDSFNLARNLYVQGKYELCLTELAKVHELIPQHENSKELQSFCEQGRELVKRQRDLEYKEREKAQIEQQISGYVESCKAKLAAEATVDETRQCLSEAMELDPEHHLITEMVHNAQIHEQERLFMAQRKEETNRKAASGQAHYKKAYNLYKSGKLSKALAEYDRFLNSTYPRVENEKAKARREIAAIKTELKTKVEQSLAECKALGAKQKFKEAYLSCSRALEDEVKNDEAENYRQQMLGELRREMKNIYEDSVLEESLGNVDSAKEKWKKILKEDLDFDDYAKKAKSKLQKYGGGF